jgi:small subunit ribosomal protein S6
MNDYEILLMLDPDVPEERHEEILTRTRELIERQGGAWDASTAWGRRRLAYEIDHRSEGVYHLLTFSCEPAALDETSRVLKITDGVMRHMATRRPRPHRRASQAAPRADSGQAEYAAETAGAQGEAGISEGEE